MVIYCRVEQPGLNCTLKLLTILMPPNHPKMYLFPTEGCGAIPVTVVCSGMQSLQRTGGRDCPAGFQGRLSPQLLIAVGRYESSAILSKNEVLFSFVV